MAETDVQTNLNDGGDKMAGAARRTAETTSQAARKGADTAADAAKAGIEAEQRSFGAAADAGRQSAEAIGRAAKTSLKASQEMARHSHDIARRAGDQAADFWRSSMTPMSQMQTEFGRWFDQMWRQASPMGSPMALLAPFTGHPLADLRETNNGFELCVELPGLKAEDVDLSLRGDTLVLSGEKTSEAEAGQGGYRFSERRFGRFERVFPLPAGIDRTRIDASFEDGLLRVALPAAPEGEAAQNIRIKG